MGLRGLLAGALLAWSGAGQAAWQEASSKHFVVYADDAPDKVRAFTARLERFDKAMRVLRRLDDPALSPTQRVTVYVLDDQGDVGKLYGRGGDGIAGFYDARASGPVAFVPRRGATDKYALTPQQVLFHEYAHHLMYSTSGNYFYPPWYAEGFAEFSATAAIEDDGGVMFGAVPMYRLYGIAAISPMTARQLLTADPARLTPEARETMYGRGWLLTHYLTTDAARQRQLRDYLAALNAGRSVDEAAAALGGAKALDKQLALYTHQKLKGFVVPAAKIDIGAVTLRPLTPGEAATMPARVQSTRGVNAKTAPRVAALAKKLATPYPADPAAQNVLAEALLDAGDPPGALAAAERALAADPRSLHATVYRGLALQAMALKTNKPDPAAVKTSRAAFVAANHLDHDAPWPLELNYMSFLAADQKPTVNAEEGLLTAAVLAPYDDNLLLLAARVMLGRDKPAEARGYLTSIAYNPHGGAAAAFAGNALSLIDAGNAAAALALFTAKPVEEVKKGEK